MENHLWEITPRSPERDSNLDLPVLGSLTRYDTSALTNYAAEVGNLNSSPVASLVLTDSSQLTYDSQHLGIYSSPMASLVLTYSSQLTSDSQHLGIYSSPVASLVLIDSSQLTSDSQHLAHDTKIIVKAYGAIQTNKNQYGAISIHTERYESI
uniref:Uncharacterized protein n=1 Tax=Timema monikensis TaxID=170555 RepID=A0A7R9HPR1_9NEOP|nr:unnamed protein product [Timema monikensis]